MSKNKQEELNKQKVPQEQEPEQMKLDDARRVKVLSPGMLVFKRFIRNKLAVAGIIILAVMFVYSFLGPIFSPYTRAQMFFKEVTEPGKYATGKFNTDSRFIGDVGTPVQSGVLKALGTQKKGSAYVLTQDQVIPFTARNEHYTLKVINPSETAPACAIYGTTHAATIGKDGKITHQMDNIDEGLLEAILADAEAGGKETEFDYNGTAVSVEISKIERKYYVPSTESVAVSTYNIYTPIQGKASELQSDTEFLHAVSAAVMAGETTVSYNDTDYVITGDAENGYVLSYADGAGLFNITRDYRYGTVNVESQDAEGNPITEEKAFLETLTDPEGFTAALTEALGGDAPSFTFEGAEYTIEKTDVEIHVISPAGEPAVVISNSFVPVGSKYDALNADKDFAFALETAFANGDAGFEFNGEQFTIVDNGDDYTVQNAAGDDILLASDIAYGAESKGIELTLDFVKKLQEAMRNKEDTFTFVDQHGEETEATIQVVNGNYYVSTMQKTSLLDFRAAPTSSHPLGTDVNGMDVFTRLMYGGRVSLLVGFVVIFFELFLGVIIGGISGYFGGVVDTILMRFVELFNAIPFYPMLIILGSVMDNMHVGATQRLFMTMVILGVLGWTGIARIVRGQILSLREQDFMVAAEATGIRTSRKIFRHLIPNVMPLLIVNATAGLGSVILTEATHGFLGLGVKYPMASWGSIINQVNDMQVMQTAWWIWIPAGLLILVTVLGFNFVGDGLRDAFDPKMKR